MDNPQLLLSRRRRRHLLAAACLAATVGGCITPPAGEMWKKGPSRPGVAKAPAGQDGTHHPQSSPTALVPTDATRQVAFHTEDGYAFPKQPSGPVQPADHVALDPQQQAGSVESRPAVTSALAAPAFGPVGQPAVALDLSAVLAMVGPQTPEVGFARWRVQEAYAQWDRAKVLWLPSLQGGFSFHRHDGHLQASDGSIVDVNRTSLQASMVENKYSLFFLWSYVHRIFIHCKKN